MIMPGRSIEPDEGSDAFETWDALSEAVRDCAEGYAATDPRNGSLYRRDAELFCGRLPPHGQEEVHDRFAEAAGLREQWGIRLARRIRRIPR